MIRGPVATAHSTVVIMWSASPGPEPKLSPPVLQPFALNLIKMDTSTTDSFWGKHQRASWSDDDVVQVVAFITQRAS